MNIINKFCHNCGVKLVPTAKFCGECGTSQASLASKPPEPAAKPQQKKQNQSFEPFVARRNGDNGDDDDDDSYIDHIDHLNISISSLDVDLGQQGRPVKETFAGVMSHGAQMGQNADSFTRQTFDPGPVDQQAFLKQFQQEAGTLRNK